jgi:site-specific DNA-methyltransferase (adenine-specific)
MSLLLNNKKIELDNMTDNNNNIVCNIEVMDFTKLSKTELLAKCEENGIKKCKSKTKEELIDLLEKKPVEKKKIKVIIEDDEEEIKNEVIIQQDLEINKIHNEDCIVGMKKIKSESVDIIICDPPYNIGKDFGNDSDKQKMDDYLLWCDNWIAECLRILKPQGTIYIYGFSEILAFIRTRVTCNVRWLVWHYTNKVTPSLNFWQRTHESILCCYKDKPTFNRDDVREPYTETFLNNS